MAVKRKRLTLAWKVDILFAQALCPLCGEPLGSPRNIHYDHEKALTNGGKDEPANLRAVHIDCHAAKTWGPGGKRRIHTRGSDISEPARLDAIAEKHRDFRRRLAKPSKAKKAKKAKWPSRPLRSKP